MEAEETTDYYYGSITYYFYKIGMWKSEEFTQWNFEKLWNWISFVFALVSKLKLDYSITDKSQKMPLVTEENYSNTVQYWFNNETQLKICKMLVILFSKLLNRNYLIPWILMESCTALCRRNKLRDEVFKEARQIAL